MGEAGIFAEDDRFELVDGQIVEMTPIGPRHAAIVDRLTRLFTSTLGERAIVRVQNPAVVDPYSEPQPDVSLLAPQDDFYFTAHPRTPDVLLLVEVADSTLRFDRMVKRPIYAAAGLREFWIVDIGGQVVESYRQPSGADFGERLVFTGSDTINPVAFPDVAFAVSAILG